MIEKLNTAVRFRAFFTSIKQGKAGLLVTVDVYRPDDALIVSGLAAIEIGQGLYSYTLPGASVTLIGEYVAIFKTSDATVDVQTIPALWVVGRAGVANLDAAVSTRSTYNGLDTTGVTTLLSRITGVLPLASEYTAARALKLDFLDRAISLTSTQLSVNAIPTAPLLAINYTTPPTVAQISAGIGSGPGGATVTAILSALTTGYATGTVGYALDKLNLTAAPSVIPGPSSDASTCRVYGYFETIDNKPAPNINVSITLVSPGLTVSNKGIAGRVLRLKTDATGTLVSSTLQPYLDLQRNDLLTPVGSYYSVTCEALGVIDVHILLTTATRDLVAALAAAV